MRYIIVDYMHRVYKTMNCKPLSCAVNFNGEMLRVDTTIPNYTIKSIFNFSGKGSYPTVVCLEGGCPSRVNYFSSINPTGKKADGYKDGRGRLSGVMRDGMNLAVGCMQDGNVACAREIGYEADDYVYSVVMALKEAGVKDPIDVFTNDRDMLPLVDDQVSVYINNPRQFNEETSPKITGYFQVTPRSWDTYVYYASEYKGYDIPYNSVLLYKMIKGDKADNINYGIKGYGGVKFSSVIKRMREDGCAFESIFRYGLDFDKHIAPVLKNYFTDDEIASMKFIYNGINLMRVQTADGSPIVMPKMIDIGTLSKTLLRFNIHLT